MRFFFVFSSLLRLRPLSAFFTPPGHYCITPLSLSRSRPLVGPNHHFGAFYKKPSSHSIWLYRKIYVNFMFYVKQVYACVIIHAVNSLVRVYTHLHRIIMENTAVAKNAQVTFEDVRAAVGDSDPNLTNSSKIRLLIGRGSFGTIQKHLETLRDTFNSNSIPLNTSSSSELPPPPVDLIQSIWSSAYLHALNIFRDRNDLITKERDQLLNQIISLKNDLSDALRTNDNVDQVLLDAMSDRDSALSELSVLKDTFNLLRIEYDSYRSHNQAITNDLNVALSRDFEIEKRDRIIERQLSQSTIDSLTNQIVELKLLLSIQSQKSSPQKKAPVQKAPSDAPKQPQAR